MESSTWQVILAIAGAALLQSIAYWIRENANNRKMARLQTSVDGNTALCATNLVSSGNLPKAAPCIPAVAKAVSTTVSGCEDSATYAQTAVNVAHATMEREGIPVQTQDLLVQKLQKMLLETQAKADDTATKEERHAQNNAAWAQILRDEIDRLKCDVTQLKQSDSKTKGD